MSKKEYFFPLRERSLIMGNGSGAKRGGAMPLFFDPGGGICLFLFRLGGGHITS